MREQEAIVNLKMVPPTHRTKESRGGGGAHLAASASLSLVALAAEGSEPNDLRNARLHLRRRLGSPPARPPQPDSGRPDLRLIQDDHR